MEQQLIKKITGGLMGIKLGTKEPKEVAVLLNKLKSINVMMYEEFFEKYKNLVVKDQDYKVLHCIFKVIKK